MDIRVRVTISVKLSIAVSTPSGVAHLDLEEATTFMKQVCEGVGELIARKEKKDAESPVQQASRQGFEQ